MVSDRTRPYRIKAVNMFITCYWVAFICGNAVKGTACVGYLGKRPKPWGHQGGWDSRFCCTEQYILWVSVCVCCVYDILQGVFTCYLQKNQTLIGLWLSHKDIWTCLRIGGIFFSTNYGTQYIHRVRTFTAPSIIFRVRFHGVYILVLYFCISSSSCFTSLYLNELPINLVVSQLHCAGLDNFKTKFLTLRHVTLKLIQLPFWFHDILSSLSFFLVLSGLDADTITHIYLKSNFV